MSDTRLTQIIDILDELSLEYEWGGGEDGEGTLQPGKPDFGSAKERIKALFVENVQGGMSERITEAELLALADEAERNIRGGDPLRVRLRLAEDPRRRNILDLIDEVRRLRGMIVKLGAFRGNQSRRVAAFAELYGVEYVGLLGALEAEARAIREESAKA